MANTQQKRGYFKLDVEDMERRIVEFRVHLDREKRRCQAAHMTDKFEQLLRDKLNELRPAQETSQDNSIQLLTLDNEGFGKLSNFLKNTIDMCKHYDQHDQYQNVLRQALQLTRRKRVLVHDDDGARPLEPFCLFCASDLSSLSCTKCTHHVDAHQNQQHQPHQPHQQQQHQQHQPQQTDMQATEQIAYTPANGYDEDEDDHHHQHHFNYNVEPNLIPSGNATPPPSATPTPEVGEQARDPLWIEHPSLEQFQRHFSQSFTSSTSPPQAYTPNIPSVDNISKTMGSHCPTAASTTPPMSPAPSAAATAAAATATATVALKSSLDSQQVNSTTSQTAATAASQHDQASTNASSRQQQQQQQQQPQQGSSSASTSGTYQFVAPSDSSSSSTDSESDIEKDSIRSILDNLDGHQLANDGLRRSSTPLSDRLHKSMDGNLIIDEDGNTSQELPTPVKTRQKKKGRITAAIATIKQQRLSEPAAPISSTPVGSGGGGAKTEKLTPRLRDSAVRRKFQPKRRQTNRRG